MPPKKSFFLSGVHKKLIEERRLFLQKYLEELLKNKAILESELFSEWLSPENDVILSNLMENNNRYSLPIDL